MATYDNYRVVVTTTTASADGNDIQVRFRAAGTDSAAGYYYGGVVATSAPTTGTVSGTNGNQFVMQQTSTARTSIGTVDISSPFGMARTSYNANVAAFTTVAFVRAIGGMHDTTASYDGLTVFVSSGTFTGTIRVYGYRSA